MKTSGRRWKRKVSWRPAKTKNRRANFVHDESAEEQARAAALRRYFDRFSTIKLICTTSPCFEPSVGIVVVPAERVGWVTLRAIVGRPRLICYGPARLLRAAYVAGCDDYLKDPWTVEELALRAERLFPPGTAEFEWGTLEIGPTQVTVRSTASQNARTVPLSRPESLILGALLDNRPDPVPRAALYHLLWNKPGDGSRAVDVHVSRLRSKLADVVHDGRYTGLIKTVHGTGYLIP